MKPSFARYQVNLLIDHSASKGAPVIDGEYPTYQNLLGRIEHLAQMGALTTDFTLIKAGLLHRANGGYLLLDAQRVLSQPFAWEGLKQALRAGNVQIESLAQALSLVSTVSLEPEPIPLDLKVVLIGPAWIYYLLCRLDPDFNDLFKVAADFDDQIPRTAENSDLYLRMIATVARRDKLRPLDRAAAARVIERSARLAGDGEKLSARVQAVVDLLREADYWAGQAGREVVTAEDVERATSAQIHRSDLLSERVQEEIRRGTILIDMQGAKTGQVNALSVIDLGQFAFGRPSRITARVRMGSGDVLDIEREVELGGPIHSKGVLILSSFLGGRYATDRPLSLAASLVFEQSYAGVEGDSASCAELYALLSALAEAPIRQSLAVTGSVNQHGEVQAIGGVNEKIEGFFDLCAAAGLTGDQGVLIPASNVKHLMLKQEVVDAAAAGRFHVYAVQTIDQGITLLTGMPAGARDVSRVFPEGTINARVEARLIDLSEKKARYGGGKGESDL
jgi:lon-related putative ATP-dependent protease